MTPREPLKNKAYLENVYHYYQQEAATYEDMLTNKASEIKRIDNLHLLQTGHYFYWLRAAYSLGKPVQELIPLYDALVYHWHAYYTWPDAEIDIKVNIDSYFEAIQFCALGVLLHAKGDTFHRLKALLALFPVDVLLSRFSDCFGVDDKKASKLFFKKSFEPLMTIFGNLTTESKEDALKSYLSQWMKLLKPVVYIGSHKVKANDTAFAGYWSFEAAAICVIEQLYTDAFKDAPFFPMDLLHFYKNQ